MIIIAISSSFFLAEIGVGFYVRSLALVADAFHYLNDLIGFIVALIAFKISGRTEAPKELSFGWQRANLLGAFFNGVFLLALGVSIFLQSVERFVNLQEVQNPKLVLIIGCIGLALNIISAFFLHEHDESVKMAVDSELAASETTPDDNVNLFPSSFAFVGNNVFFSSEPPPTATTATRLKMRIQKKRAWTSVSWGS